MQPYYLVDNAKITLDGNKVNASFDVNNVAGKGIDRVMLLLGTSSYVMIIIMWIDMMKLITWLNTKTEVRLMYFKQEIMPNIKCFKLL